MKTPDEIKTGLELCYADIDCSECPYLLTCFDNDEAPYGAVMPDALAYIQQLEAQVPKWISVKERLPELGERVLVTNGGFVCESYLNIHKKWMRAGSELFFMTPYYWMPLPEPPKED